MHYRLLLRVALQAPLVKVLRGKRLEFVSYCVSLGVNGQNAADALALAEEYALAMVEGNQSGIVTEVELEAIPRDEVPQDVLTRSTANPDVGGVYWASGRIYGEEGSFFTTSH